MMNPDRVKALKEMVASQRELMFAAERHIWKHPETGYREWKTHEYLAAEYRKLGYELVEAGNIPGFYTDIDTGKPGPKLLIMGELDSLIVSTHPECDPETGYVHACGHHAQSAALLGIAAALKQPGALDGMSGSIRLMAVPAEELIEIGYRASLRVAKDLGAESVAFPAISAGVYGWPMDDAARIAVQTIRNSAAEVAETIETVVLVPFGDEAEAAFRRWVEESVKAERDSTGGHRQLSLLTLYS